MNYFQAGAAELTEIAAQRFETDIISRNISTEHSSPFFNARVEDEPLLYAPLNHDRSSHDLNLAKMGVLSELRFSRTPDMFAQQLKIEYEDNDDISREITELTPRLLEFTRMYVKLALDSKTSLVSASAHISRYAMRTVSLSEINHIHDPEPEDRESVYVVISTDSTKHDEEQLATREELPHEDRAIYNPSQRIIPVRKNSEIIPGISTTRHIKDGTILDFMARIRGYLRYN